MCRKITFVFKTILFGSFFLMWTSAQSQYFDAGFMVGVADYKGEFKEAFPTLDGDKGLSLAFCLKYHFNERVAVRFQYMRSDLSADTSTVAEGTDPFMVDLNNSITEVRSFETTTTQLALLAEYNIIPLELDKEGFQIVPYLLGGVQGILFTPTTDPDLGYEVQQALSVPLGIGLKFKIGSGTYLNVEGLYHQTFTDVLDGVILDSSNDAFGTLTFGFSKMLQSGGGGSSVRCPKVNF